MQSALDVFLAAEYTFDMYTIHIFRIRYMSVLSVKYVYHQYVINQK